MSSKKYRAAVSGFLSVFFTVAGGCMPVRNLFQPLRALAGTTRVETNIRYRKDSNNPRHALDLMIPRDLERPGGLVLFVHGGFWSNQDRRYYRPITGLYWNVGYALARQGYAVAILSYRIYPEARIAGQLADIQAALAWAGSNLQELNIEENRLFLMGHSAGGHLASLAALENSGKVKPAGVVALSPVLDIAHMRAAQPADFNREITDPVFGAQASEAELRRWSPGRRWTEDAPPLLVLTGENDYPFLIEQAAAFARRRSAGEAVVKIRQLPDLEHADLVLDFDANPSPVLPAVLEFLAHPASAGADQKL
ncbi:MAG: alpha/beta hydrolase [Leptospirales bacterium]|jgi:acetyl esterase/lipase